MYRAARLFLPADPCDGGCCCCCCCFLHFLQKPRNYISSAKGHDWQAEKDRHISGAGSLVHPLSGSRQQARQEGKARDATREASSRASSAASTGKYLIVFSTIHNLLEG
ncbi:hypothetical protein PoB_001001200 [Plakobranchus ocellatus]|uniref:Secreted protein n=1 Tax=Plakobranchus ocellatus TaxID=259542 RepID=A0AAV3YKS7_9GAST|nr:hypothetical protein PoB_001001200 [Plakobranchus ocellatus]